MFEIFVHDLPLGLVGLRSKIWILTFFLKFSFSTETFCTAFLSKSKWKITWMGLESMTTYFAFSCLILSFSENFPYKNTILLRPSNHKLHESLTSHSWNYIYNPMTYKSHSCSHPYPYSVHCVQRWVIPSTLALVEGKLEDTQFSK